MKLDKDKINLAKSLIDANIIQLRNKTPGCDFNKDIVAEIEVNKFYYQGKIVDRAMIVLRANGCEHYKKTGGCSMCSHFNGINRHTTITTQNYINQWDSIVKQVYKETNHDFNFNNYPVVCVYNLGSLLNPNEIAQEVVSYIFNSLNKFSGVKKIIIESRYEYVTEENLKNISQIYNGIVEVGIGVESSNTIIRELCHHKGMQDFDELKNAIKTLHDHNMKALAYVNVKPVFLTEQEAVCDAIKTAVDCFNLGFDAVSLEPTSLQNYSLSHHLFELGLYRVPWLWSVREIVKGIYNKLQKEKLDIRIGGYFDEEVLSGSQGVGYEKRNEIFPSLTSLNCNACSTQMIECIKKFNQTYNIKELYKINKCEKCYNLWQETMGIKDSRDIPSRILDHLANNDSIYNLRLADNNDLKQLKTIYDAAVKDLLKKEIYIYWSKFYPYPVIEEDIKKEQFYVLEVMGTIVGGVSILNNLEGEEFFKWKKDNCIFISRLAIYNKYQRLGIAGIFLNKILKFAQNQNKDSIKLLVSNVNIPALNLYTKFGFEKVDGEYIEIIEEPDMILTEYGFEYTLK